MSDVIRSQDKRDKLRLLYDDLKRSGDKRLKDLLMDGLRMAQMAIDGGGVTPGTFLSSTSEASGHSAFEALGNYTPEYAKRLLGELLDCYDLAVTTVGSEDTDAPLYAWMMASLSLNPPREFQNDYTGMRYGGAIYSQ